MDGTAQEKAGNNTRGDNWVADIQNEVRAVDAEKEFEMWRNHCIYRVPSYIKDLNPKAYMPQVVSIGPYHHGEEHLRPMEEHKRRSLLHLLHRCGKPLESFMAAAGEVVQQLMDAYEQLDGEWRDNWERFLWLMVVDGCFMLEIMRAATAPSRGYAYNDPIFGSRGMLYTALYIRWDMALIENQLPLLLLQKLEAVETGMTKEGDLINGMVCNFFPFDGVVIPSMPTLRLHLDVWREVALSMMALRWPSASASSDGGEDLDITYKTQSATELSEAGIRFKRVRSPPESNWFEDGVLSLPPILVDETTESVVLNLIAFERLRNGASNEVTSFAFFMSRIAKSGKDVALLRSRGIILDAVGNDKSIADMFDRMSIVATVNSGSPLSDVLRRMRKYSERPWRRWRANIVRNYFRIPGTGYSLAGAVLVLGLTVAQVVYAALQYHQAAKS